MEREDVAFLDSRTHSSDTLAEHMGEAVIEAITSGQDDELENRDATVMEELGGPFLETSDETEQAEDNAESNVQRASRRPHHRN